MGSRDTPELVAYPLPQASSSYMHGGNPSGSVVMVSGLHQLKMNCSRVFNLFCLYGNIEKVRHHLWETLNLIFYFCLFWRSLLGMVIPDNVWSSYFRLFVAVSFFSSSILGEIYEDYSRHSTGWNGWWICCRKSCHTSEQCQVIWKEA